MAHAYLFRWSGFGATCDFLRMSAGVGALLEIGNRTFSSARAQDDADSATSWRDLPPATTANAKARRKAGIRDNSTRWRGRMPTTRCPFLCFRPDSPATPNEIVIDYSHHYNSLVCNRQ